VSPSQGSTFSTVDQGCQCFISQVIYQNWETITNYHITYVPNCHKIKEIAIKYIHQIVIHKQYQKAFQNIPTLGVWVCKYKIWQPWPSLTCFHGGCRLSTEDDQSGFDEGGAHSTMTFHLTLEDRIHPTSKLGTKPRLSFFSTVIMAHAFFLPQPEWLIQGEIITSSMYIYMYVCMNECMYVCRLSPTLISNKNQRGFRSINKRGDGHHHWIQVITSLMY
jgi:hypothetical protein